MMNMCKGNLIGQRCRSPYIEEFELWQAALGTCDAENKSKWNSLAAKALTLSAHALKHKCLIRIAAESGLCDCFVAPPLRTACCCEIGGFAVAGIGDCSCRHREHPERRRRRERLRMASRDGGQAVSVALHADQVCD